MVCRFDGSSHLLPPQDTKVKCEGPPINVYVLCAAFEKLPLVTGPDLFCVPQGQLNSHWLPPCLKSRPALHVFVRPRKYPSLPLSSWTGKPCPLYRLNSTFYNETKGINRTPSAMIASVFACSIALQLLQRATSRTKLTSRTCEPARSSRTGIRSRSSLSWASENQLLMGTACWGWKIYDVGELSIMIVSRRSRPTCERSLT